MDVFSSASHEDILRLLFQIAVLLMAARLLGYAAKKLGQPSVLGEILAGIILGPSLLSGIWPAFGSVLMPQTVIQGNLLELMGLLGALFLLLATGLEIDPALIRRHAATAIGVSWMGVAISFAAGFVLAGFLPSDLLADSVSRTVFSMFLGTIFAISAIPVLAKILMDMELMRRDIGQTIIAAGMSDDTIGWILLSVIAGLAAGEYVTANNVLVTVGMVGAFLVLSFTIGRRLVLYVIEAAQQRLASVDGLVTIAVGFTILWAAITQAMNFEAVLGAFVMGIILGQMHMIPRAVHERIKTLSMGIFTPVFFGIAGLKVDVMSLATPQLALITLTVILVSSIAKIGGAFLGARLIGRKKGWYALSFGVGLNAGGAMKILVATIGLQLGILTQDMFSILVVMSIFTTLVVPFTLPRVLEKVVPDPDELERLNREKLVEGSLVSGIRSIFLPVRLRDEPGLESIEAKILEQMARNRKISLTLLCVVEPGVRSRAIAFLERIAPEFRGLDVKKRVIESSDVAGTIAGESQKYHDLMVLGAPEKQSTTEILFNPLVDFLVRSASCPTMLIKSRSKPGVWPPRRILVPSDGSHSSRRAAELALSLIEGLPKDPEEAVNITFPFIDESPGDHQYSDSSSKVLFLNVVTDDYRSGSLSLDDSHIRRVGRSKQIVDDLVKQARDLNVRALGEVRAGVDPETVILSLAKERKMDLILLGTDIRPGSSRLFLGPRVEWILDRAECPVLVLNSA